MGCIHFKVKPNASEKSKSNLLHTNTVQDISGDLNISKTSSIVVYRNPSFIPRKSIVSSIISNKSEDLTPRIESVISTVSNDSHNNINKETSIDPKEPRISKENISNIPPVDINIPVTSNESHRIYHPINSPSNRSDTVVYRHNANHQFLSARANKFNTSPESIHNNNYIESDTSFPTHNSIISTISADSEGSVVSQIEPKKGIFVRPKQANVQQKPSSESDESELQHEKRDNSAVVDVTAMTEHLVTVMRRTSTKLNTSDFYHSGSLSETESGTDEV
ncbi:unnamed protein product [Rotaria sordida]|uniref:Uncharacterized protein n=1 Tax=Rotaria sordida TaxID=392033 RepID=A0A815B032_9BILA|nr:unnamed protein product [Rotaria sordida]CAF3850064.1 unnamed protein product [Rotaria sordida]